MTEPVPILMPSPSPRLRLPRSARLRHRRDFLALRAEGERVVSGCVIVNVRRALAGGRSRVGVVTGRGVGSAVVRNRARRLLREAFRRHQGDWAEPVDVVLVARPSIAARSFPQVERDFLSALKRASSRRVS